MGAGFLALMHYVGGYYPALVCSAIVSLGAISIDVYFGVSFNVAQLHSEMSMGNFL